MYVRTQPGAHLALEEWGEGEARLLGGSLLVLGKKGVVVVVGRPSSSRMCWAELVGWLVGEVLGWE